MSSKHNSNNMNAAIESTAHFQSFEVETVDYETAIRTDPRSRILTRDDTLSRDRLARVLDAKTLEDLEAALAVKRFNEAQDLIEQTIRSSIFAKLARSFGSQHAMTIYASIVDEIGKEMHN